MEAALSRFQETMRSLEAQCSVLVSVMRTENSSLRNQMLEATWNREASGSSLPTSQHPNTNLEAVTPRDSVPVESSLPVNSSPLLTPGRLTGQLLEIPQIPGGPNLRGTRPASWLLSGSSANMMPMTPKGAEEQQVHNECRIEAKAEQTNIEQIGPSASRATSGVSFIEENVTNPAAGTSNDSQMHRSVTETSAASSKMSVLWSMLPQSTRGSPTRSNIKSFQVREAWDDHKYDSMSLQHMLTVERRCEFERANSSKTITYEASWSSADASKAHCFILHPQSKARTFWTLACAALLLHDFIMVPFDVCFEPEETQFSRAVGLSTAVFWTFDILLTFVTGIETDNGVQMGLKTIAQSYCRSWLAFDVFLVLQEWLTVALVDWFRSGQISVLRMARWARFMRLLRLARILRLGKWTEQFYRVAYSFRLSQTHLIASQGWLSMSLSCVIVTHLLSCLWYYIGNSLDNGWAQAYHTAGAELSQIYVISVHWSFNRLHGFTNNHVLETTWEIGIDALLIFLSLFLASFYIGKVTAITMAVTNDGRRTMWNRCLEFVQRRKISEEVKFNLLKIVEGGDSIRAAEIAQEESMLLEALPSSIRHDLVFEARNYVLIKNAFFRDLVCFNRRAVRQICNKAITSLTVVVDEFVFVYADACSRMIFIDSGMLEYVQGRKFSTNRSPNSQYFLKAIDSISEPVLWTKWEHMGHLVVLEEAMVFSLDAAEFLHVIAQYTGPHMHAVRYAKHFVWNLKNCKNLNDLISFPGLTIDNLDDDVFAGDEQDHFIFISHYKVEAGTEATLIRDLLLPMLKRDASHPANHLRSPIFIDSEDLDDLSQLKAHVAGSTTLVVLLTPGVLSRPWCLIEIVTALNNGVNIVLVEVQRPGSSYRYPDEAFYAGLWAGKLLSQQGMELLTREGVSLVDVESCIRQVFHKIACPFSPHKTKTVRDAELHDILERCNVSLYGFRRADSPGL